MICAVLGIIAVIYAVIYVTVPIHSLPGFVPGKHGGGGHYHKRAALVGLIGIVLLAIAAVVGTGARRAASTGAGSTPGPAAGSAPNATAEKAPNEGGAAPS